MIRDRLLAEFTGRTVIWAMQQRDWASLFDDVIELDGGRLVRHGQDDATGEAERFRQPVAGVRRER